MRIQIVQFLDTDDAELKLKIHSVTIDGKPFFPPFSKEQQPDEPKTRWPDSDQPLIKKLAGVRAPETSGICSGCHRNISDPSHFVCYLARCPSMHNFMLQTETFHNCPKCNIDAATEAFVEKCKLADCPCKPKCTSCGSTKGFDTNTKRYWCMNLKCEL